VGVLIVGKIVAGLFLALASTAAFAASSSAAADDAANCKAYDHYYNLDRDYLACDRALKVKGISKEERALLLFGRGETAYFAGRFDIAIVDLDESISLKPNFGEAYLRRGWTRNHLGEYSAALQDFSNFLEMEPDNPAALFAIGFVYIDSDSWQTKTLPAFNRALEIDPNNYLTRFNLASIYSERDRRPDLAVTEYDRILKASDEELSKVRIWRIPGRNTYFFKNTVRYVRALALIDAGNPGAAMEALDGLVADQPYIVDSYITRGALNLQQRKYIDVLANAEKAEKIAPYVEEYKAQMLQAFFYLKRHEEGLKSADRFLAGDLSNQTRGDIYFWRGIFQKHLNNPEQALLDLENSFSLAPRNLMSVISQLIQRGYYTGSYNDAYSDKVRNGLQACLIDPECAT
jgi:tetratricopeptide (TPR) repeat protein